LSEFNCRLQGKYGKGDDYLDNAVMVGSFAFGGGASLLLKTPQYILRGFSLSEKALKITETSSKVLLYTSMGVNAIDVAKQVDSECLSHRPAILFSGKSSCKIKDDQDFEKYEIASLAERNCVLSVSFNVIPGVATLASYKSFQKFILRNKSEIDDLAPLLEHRAGKKIKKGKQSEHWKELVDNYNTKVITTYEENQEFERMAKKMIHHSEDVKNAERPIILDIENSELKALNKKLPKDVVTSLDNLFFERMKNRMKQFELENPKLKVHYYYDYKSLRVGFTKTSKSNARINKKWQADFEEKLQKAFNDEYAAFIQELKDKKYIRTSGKKTDTPENWFKASLCDHPGVGNITTRAVRQLGGSILKCNDEKVRAHLIEQLQGIEKERSDFQTQFGNTSLMDNVRSETGKTMKQKTFKDDIFQFARKSETDEEFLDMIHYDYPSVELRLDQASAIRAHAQKVDSFSPPNYILKREVSIISDDATEGAGTLDFIGLGGKNLSATADSLARASRAKSLNPLERVSAEVDKGIEQVTELLTKDKNTFKNMTGDRYNVSATGDDIEMVPKGGWSRQDRILMISRAKKAFSLPVRSVFSTSKNISAMTRKLILAQGEELQTIVVKGLKSKYPSQKLSDFEFHLEMNGKEALNGDIDLILDADVDDFWKSPDHLDTLKNILKESINNANEVFHNRYPNITTSYQVGEVIH
jgi:hypothetical protein